ncbi:MAG: nucleotidyltransferase family protein [Rhodospirillales bacterium]|nr:nucleotidyltransferase family protein [Rhodospirillales bacterium]
MAGVAGIILAAGLSRRFSGNKLRASFQGETVLCRVVTAALASNLSRVIVVLGHQAAELRAMLSGLSLDIVINERFVEGQSSSIKTGIAALDDDCKAAMFLAADQPLMTPDIINALIDGYFAEDMPICHPMVGGKRRNPAIFDRSLFPDLMALAGDEGGRKVIDTHPGQAAMLEFQDFRPFADVDTMDDLKALENAL